MKVELFPFQKIALKQLRLQSAEALGSYRRTHTPQVVSFTAPTGAGKTIIIASLIEAIYFGDENYPDQQNAIFVWLSDSPQLNEQSKQKIDLKADKIRLDQCVTISEDSFDREILEDGHIYFLNTQKLGKSSNLTRHSDNRQYTIWETLANTAREKNDRLYVIIDEAHRGMQGREAGRATSIMQKFLKGSPEDRLSAMPVVIGMSATLERFNKLVEGTTSTIYRVVVAPEDVRASGLLKDRIVITYPEEHSVNKDMAVLQAAADDWKGKWDHWYQYCYEQHYGQVNPIFVVQVLNNTADRISDTDLDDCLRKIEERTGFRFQSGEVVHTFGQTSGTVHVNGLNVRYEEPSRITEDKNIRVVFFKENLSTGWDCPRAETMMSFRHAKDATYIAQLLGRMVRTPMQMHIQVDDTLNDVHLYLPYFDAATVEDVVNALQSTEGGNIPTEVYGETLSGQTFDTLTVKPVRHHKHIPQPDANQMTLFPREETGSIDNQLQQATSATQPASAESTTVLQANTPSAPAEVSQNDGQTEPAQSSDTSDQPAEQSEPQADLFDREAVMKFINDSCLLTYDVRTVRINDYLISLYRIARLLSQSGLYAKASKDVVDDVVQMVHVHTEALKANEKYQEYADQVRQFKLSTQIFDVFGETVDNYSVHDLFTTTDTDIDRQFRLAETKLGNEGVGNEYGRQYFDVNDPNAFKIDVIIFASDSECIGNLKTYAEAKFHALNDEYRRYIATIDSERIRRQYDSIVSDGDIVSKHNFRLPETIQVPHENGGKEYRDHLFVDGNSGMVTLNLNNWEEGVIAEEEQRPDFVCWLRNPPRKTWSLCIPYEIDGETKPTYPDFIVVRRDSRLGYVIDILEPHNPAFTDNLGKAKGFAEYARQNPSIGRIQLIRMSKDVSGQNRFKRLDMSKSAVRDKVSHAMTNDEIDHIFDADGFFMD
ncbi:MAG: DEAD/DEAH box helicase family protein [Oscillospiraceae bacterium]|jgi:type III restriction enzyme|nr:DEAD/DEAH box helicase family protein [Oscillospiraceae bacterium]